MRASIGGLTLYVVSTWASFGCSDRSDVMRTLSARAEFGSLRAALEVSGTQNDVDSLRLDVVLSPDDCDGPRVLSELVSLQAGDDTHFFASGLFVLAVGEYRVCASPLSAGEPSDDCAPTEDEVTVESGQTSELVLVSQCRSGNQGGLGTVVALNDAPRITRIEVDPSTHISICESVQAVATAFDPNGDPLTYTWTLADPAGGVLEGSGPSATFSGPAGDHVIVLTVEDNHAGTDSLEFSVSVSDALCPGDIDLTPPSAVSDVVATIENRRETSVRLTWTPPDEAVAGYDVAYLVVPDLGEMPVVDPVINDDNFDAAVQAPDVTGAASSTVIHDLTIEKRYLFAVRPFDAAGNRGPVVATSSPVHAQFLTLVLDPPATAPPGSQWGFSVDASTDLNGDGTADLVVGQKYGDRVYIYLGAPGGTYPDVPSAELIGPPGSGFGASVAVVGNVLAGGYEDLAIAAPTDGPVLGRVYLVSGRAWDGDVVDLSDGLNPTGSVIDFPTTTPYPAHVARLGDFDGDGDHDFAIHALGFGRDGACDPEAATNCDGALLLIKGTSNPSNFPSTVTIPNDSDMFEAYFPSDYGFYGNDWLLGITDFVEGRSAVLAAEYQAGVQRLLTRNPNHPGGFDAHVLDYGPPRFTGDTLVYDTEIGSYPAALAGDSYVAIALPNARDGIGATPGIVDLYPLTSTQMFDAPYKTFKAGGETNNFGQILVGNRYPGRPSSDNLPFFGRDALAPALIAGGRYYANKLPKLFMLTAATIAAAPADSSGRELTDTADVEYDLWTVPGINPAWLDELGTPSIDADWHGGLGFPIRDMNGDGFADLGVTEWAFEAPYTGGIIILY